MELMQILTDLRNLHTVVELGTILDLASRIYNQGQATLRCKDCRGNPQSAFVPIPTLAEQCLSLFEAVCLAYSINRKNNIFESSSGPFEQPLPRFICIRSKVQLGETDIDDDEAAVLVHMLLNRNLMRLLELLEALQETVRSLSKGPTQPFPGGTASLRACESSLDSTIHRVAMFMEQIDADKGTTCSSNAAGRGADSASGLRIVIHLPLQSHMLCNRGRSLGGSFLVVFIKRNTVKEWTHHREHGYKSVHGIRNRGIPESTFQFPTSHVGNLTPDTP